MQEVGSVQEAWCRFPGEVVRDRGRNVWRLLTQRDHRLGYWPWVKDKSQQPHHV